MKSLQKLPHPSAVIWDMDGTLIDQTAAIIRCYRTVVLEMKGFEPDAETIRRSLGGPMASTMALFIEDADLDEASRRFRSLFPKIMFEGLIVLPGALELIKTFAERKIPQAILTNKHGETARKVSEYTGFSKHIQVCVGHGDCEWHKPQPELTHHVLGLMNSVPQMACLIGDSPTDVETASNAKITCYTVATGAHSKEELTAAGAQASFDNLSALYKALDRGRK